MKRVMAGPEWLYCLGTLSYHEDVAEMDDATLLWDSYRVEVDTPPTVPAYNDRDWRFYRRAVRQEMHRRGLKTPSTPPPSPY